MEIKVNKEAWAGISEADRKRIQEILRESGSISEQDKIVGDPSVVEVFPQNMTLADGPCQAACTAAYGRATRICSVLPNPAARAICP